MQEKLEKYNLFFQNNDDFFSISRSGVLEMIKECIDDEKTPKEIIIEVKDSCAKNNISEQDALVMVNIL